jgi:acetyl-CoA C-acetyltransferase
MKDVYIVEGLRTPQAKSGLDLKDVPVPHLGIGLIRSMMDKYQLPEDLDCEVITGNTGAPAKYPNISRVIALEAGLPLKTSAYTVHRNCASGMEALSQATVKIQGGHQDVVFAGGIESMSQMPLIFSKELTELFVQMMKSKSLGDKLKTMGHFRFPYLSPVIAIEQGLTDPFCGLNMGQTAELIAREMGITREQQDEYANMSHLKTVSAQKEGRFREEIVPVMIGNKVDRLLYEDVGPRANSTVEGLAKMKPYFDKKSGTVTVGNSCPITDGGSYCLLMNEESLKKYHLKPLARVLGCHFHGLEPERMGMGPFVSSYHLLKKLNLNLSQMELVEINEAFAAQILGVRLAMKELRWAQKFGVQEVMGEIPDERLNVNGGAIALGHPVGSSGSRIVVTLAHELKRRKAKYGLASLCIGGGQGGSMVIENLCT